jgi:hypothetical protein
VIVALAAGRASAADRAGYILARGRPETNATGRTGGAMAKGYVIFTELIRDHAGIDAYGLKAGPTVMKHGGRRHERRDRRRVPGARLLNGCVPARVSRS